MLDHHKKTRLREMAMARGVEIQPAIARGYVRIVDPKTGGMLRNAFGAAQWSPGEVVRYFYRLPEQRWLRNGAQD